MAARMYRNSIVAFAICLAAILGCAGAVSAQDVKLYLKDGSSVDLYKDKKSFALVIGIDQYRSQRKLNNAVNDAHRIAAELEGKGFEVTLYDDPNLTGRQLREAIDKFVQDYGYLEDARVLIWYAGHGMTIDGEGYLLGVDAPQLNAEIGDARCRSQGFLQRRHAAAQLWHRPASDALAPRLADLGQLLCRDDFHQHARQRVR